MKLGVIVPSFQDTPERALDVARRAEERGIDGVFVYDHLWPMGQPERPALSPWPLLGAIAASSTTLKFGTLVARIGLGSNEHIVDEFLTLEMIAPNRLIAGVGTGDELSRAENEAYGITFDNADERRGQLDELLTRLSLYTTTWVGAGTTVTNEIARRHGAALNFWAATADAISSHARQGEVTWAGDPDEDLEGQLTALARAGATWAVLSPRADLDRLARWREVVPRTK